MDEFEHNNPFGKPSPRIEEGKDDEVMNENAEKSKYICILKYKSMNRSIMSL